MPTIRTGNQEWDQNLNTLGSALFPDPSKAAQGYYYGSQARQSQLESNKLIDQQHWRNDYGVMSRGLPVGTPTFQQPDLPGAAPIRAPAAYLPMAGAPAATPLSSVINMTPQQAATAVPAVIQPFTQGTPQPAGSPSAVSPPAPQTTTSNGQVPENDHTSGQLHPASLNLTGVQVQASPAAANGSPAAVPPGMTLPGLMAMHGAGALAGIDAATLAGGGQALAYELFSRKIINENQFKQMLAGTGATQPLAADIAAAASVTGHRLSAGAQVESSRIGAGATVEAANIRERGAEKIAGMATTFVPDPDPVKAAQGAGRLVPLAQQQVPGGYAGTNPAAVTEAVKPVQIVKTPGAGPTYTTAGQAMQTGATSVPTSVDQQTATLDAAILAARDNPELLKPLTDAKLRMAALPKGPVDAKEADAQRQVDYRIVQEAYPQPDPITAVDLTVKDPVAFKPEAETAIRDRVTALRQSDKRLALNASEARIEAIRQLQNENVLYTPDEVNAMRRESIRDPRGRDPRIANYTPTGKPAAPHMMIGLKPKPGEEVPVPISTVVPGPTPAKPPIVNRQIRVPPKTTAAPAAVSLGASPPGVAEGAVVYGADGRPAGVNRGGQVYAQ